MNKHLQLLFFFNKWFIHFLPRLFTLTLAYDQSAHITDTISDLQIKVQYGTFHAILILVDLCL